MRGRVLLAISVLIAGISMFGCGGGGSVSIGGSTTPVGGTRDPVKATVTLHWAARSRSVNGPDSALSAAITLQNPALTTTVASMSEDRNTTPGAYTANYTTTTTVTPGPYVLSVDFHSSTGATGEVVATAVASVEVNSKGLVLNPNGGTLTVNATTNLTNISVLSNQTIPIGTPTTLLVSATDNQGNVFALTPGSVFMHISAGGSFAKLESNGALLGVAPGQVSIYAVVDGITSQDVNVSVLPPSVTPRMLALTTNALAQSPTTGLLYVTVPSTGGTYGNRVVEIDPTTGKVTRSAFVGSEPGAMAFTEDGTTLYVGLNGSNSFCAVSVSSSALKLGSTYQIPRAGVLVSDIKVQPGNNFVVAVTTQDAQDTGNEGPMVFDHGKALPTQPSGIYQGQPMVWPTASTIYAFDNTDTGFGLFQYAVNSQGSTYTKEWDGLFSGFGTTIKLYGNRIYGSDGSVVSATTVNLLGRFDIQNGCDVAVDASKGHAAIASTASGDATLYVTVFSTSSFVPVTEFTVPNVIATYPIYPTTTSGMCRFSAHGLAFRSPSDVYFVDSAPGF